MINNDNYAFPLRTNERRTHLLRKVHLPSFVSITMWEQVQQFTEKSVEHFNSVKVGRKNTASGQNFQNKSVNLPGVF